MVKQVGTSELLDTWGANGTVVIPDITKIDEGWLRGEQPPHEWMNYIHNVLGQKINHLLSRGAPDWNAETEFQAGAVVKHSGSVWIATATNSNSEPASANTDWSLALGGRGNLSGLANSVEARANLGLGTAATANVTQSPTDTTAGRLLKVGDYGNGNVSPFIEDAGVTDASVVPSYYRYTPSSIGGPPGVDFGILSHRRRQSSGGETQILIADAPGPVRGNTYVRARTTGDWPSWRRIYDTGNIIGTVSQSGGDPTGAVFEEDSNDDGHYIRYASGAQICWHEVLLSYDAEFRMSGDWTFPAQFIGNVITNFTPVGSISSITPGESDMGWMRANIVGGTGGNTVRLFQSRITGGTNFQPGDSFFAAAVSIGKWF